MFSVGVVDLRKIERVEVIDLGGRSYVNSHAETVAIEIQDDGTTLKVFTGGVSR